MIKSNQDYSALIDIGSNSMRLVIYAKEKSGRLYEVENVKAVSRLSNYLDKQQNLSQEGINVLLSTLTNFAEVLAIYPYQQFVCIATATVRQAHNRDDLIKKVKDQFDWDMVILSEKEEAYYGYLAVVNSTPMTEAITVDMGGGSTEVTYFKDRELIHSHSFPFGTLTLKALYQADFSESKNAQIIHQYVKKQFHSLPWLIDRHVPLIGIGGSARNLAQIDQNEKAYPMAGLHQYQMNLYDINRILNYLVALPLNKREKVEGLSKDRADIIIPAVETFKTLFETVKADRFILSQKGLRDGINYSWLLANHDTAYFPNVLEESLNELVMRYDLNMNQISHVHYLTRQFFDRLAKNQVQGLTSKDWFYLTHAIYVFDLGQFIDPESSAQHTFYLLANQTIDGLLNHEKLKIALIASYKNSVTFNQFIKPFKGWLTKHEQKKFRLIGALLKFTYALDATKRQVIKKIEIKVKKKEIKLKLYYQRNPSAESYQAEKQKKHLEQVLKRKIVLEFIELDQ
ncbi:Ppx/GppA family phosphatase [Amphibacillus indicireducens]|uniref:Exopolyphosphatase n=1 Tax=Amphibacillus indicireducens TaxID=1076330 RepID=A0ABP7VN19_9BACI